MFLSESHLPQVLVPDCYFEPEHYAREVSRLLVPSWHCLGLLDDLPHEGDFFTKSLLGRPLIVWRKQDRPCAFVNVCAHRFAQLTDKSCGHTDRLTCQYHGWQYDESGNAQKIPDAQSFKPLRDGQLALSKLSTVTCGKLVLASFRPQDSLENHFPWGLDILRDLASQNRRLVFRMDEPIEANWKVVIENSIESYHVGCVHANSLSIMPAAESCSHELGPRHTHFETRSPSSAPALVRGGERLIHRLLGFPFVESYKHYHFFPNLLVATSKMFSVVMVVEPLSPTQCHLVVWVLGDPGPRRGPAARIAFRMARRVAASEVRKVIREDLAVLPSIQRGLQSPERPAGGLISIREERIYHFQKWIQQSLQDV